MELLGILLAVFITVVGGIFFIFIWFIKKGRVHPVADIDWIEDGLPRNYTNQGNNSAPDVLNDPIYANLPGNIYNNTLANPDHILKR